MFCKNCGSNINDNATFCSGCGQKVEAEHPVVQAPPESVQEGPKFCPGCGRKQESSVRFCPECGYSAAQNTAQGFRAGGAPAGGGFDFAKITNTISPKQKLSDYSGADTIKRFGSSYIYVAFLFFYSLMAIVAFASVFSKDLGIISKLLDALDGYGSSMIGYNFGIAGYVENFVSGSFIGSIAVFYKFMRFIPVAIVCYGVWDFYLQSRSAKNMLPKYTGLNVIAIFYKIKFFLNLIALLVSEVGLLISMFTSNSSKLGVFGVMLVVALYFGIPVMFFKTICNTIGNIRITASGRTNAVAPIPKAILIFNVISMLSIIFTGSNWGVKILTIIALIALTVLFSQFNASLAPQTAPPAYNTQNV